MIKNYIDLLNIKNEYKANVIYSFMRRTFSIDNIKFLLMGVPLINESQIPEVVQHKDHHEIYYSIRILYSNGNKDEYREILKDKLYYIHKKQCLPGLTAGDHNTYENEDGLSVVISKNYNPENPLKNESNDFISYFFIEHILYTFNKKLDDRGIEMKSILKIYITLTLDY